MAVVTQRRGWAVAVAAALAGVLLLSVPSTAQQHVAMPPASSSSSPPPASAPVPVAAAPGPAGIDAACLNSLLNMSDCLPYVESGSKARRPDKPCCPELAGLVDSNPVCLCALFSGAADSYGISVDYPRALALPGICRVSTPPLSTCAALGYNVTAAGPSAAPPAMSPGVSPSGEGPQFPGASPFPSPPTSPSHAARRLASSAGDLLALAVFSLAATAVAGGGLL